MTLSRTNRIFAWLAAMLMVVSLSAQADVIDQKDPQKMIESLSVMLVDKLNEQRAELEQSPKMVREFAQENVLPYVDTEKMARYAMGKYWRTASDEQKKEFSDEFTTTLIRSYSQSLLKLNISSVKVSGMTEEKPGRVTVSSTVVQADGNSSDVIYRAYLDNDNNKWMIYDVTVEGISMLLNYRKVYIADISRRGLQAVIDDMKEKNKSFLQSAA
ncbi:MULTISPECIES: MlaC/ttg2D family ABC transporter substrate-binding protein [Thiomicrorhabdus]|uniref:ABC transporter substrate-binding protein n=1 Tax=Thiomicrorhabdus heinhorstiae TaxID=2748010 RepID=A0ABS0BW74_9GAMM|nr:MULTISPECIES: ABC transporter substrate-binding protein [Thiomicrorhabdus]MBF6057224.1 ABC transporter substrate-binding protein [Thiomicrorhabdus heinhorstiae]